MLELLTTLVLAAHLLAVNVGSVGPLACVALRRRDHVAADWVGRRLATLSAALLVVGALLGAALLGLLYLAGDRAYFETAAQVPRHRLGFALVEFAVALGLLVTYRLLWDRWRNRPLAHGLLAVFASANLLFHFPPLLTIIAVVGTREELRGVMLESDLYRQLLLDGEVLARVLHVWLASAAVTGMTVAVLGMGEGEKARGGEVDGANPPLTVWGARWALAATLAQLPLGLWVALGLPEPARRAMMGEAPLASALLAGGVLAALLLLHQLAALALGEVSRAAVWRAALLMALVVLLMSGTLRATRVESGGSRVESQSRRRNSPHATARLGSRLSMLDFPKNARNPAHDPRPRDAQ